MRNGWIGLALALASTTVAAGCGNSSTAGAGGSSGSGASSGGASSSGASSSSAGSGSGASSSSASSGSGASSGSAGSGSGASSSGASSSSAGSSGDAGSSCGQADGGVTTLCGTTALGALTTAQTTQLCNDTSSYFASNISNATWCKWIGLTKAANSSPPTNDAGVITCTQYESACNQADAGAGPGAGADCSESSPLGAITSACTATVAQYSACITDETAAFLTTVNGGSDAGGFGDCPMFTISDTGLVYNAMGANGPASCMSIMNACAGLSPPNPLTPSM